MVNKLATFIVKNTSKGMIIIFLAALVSAEVAFNCFIPSFVEKTGSTIIDMSPAISQEEVDLRLSSIDMAKREYFWIRSIDFVFPLVYAFAFSFLSCAIYRKKYAKLENYKWVLMVPFLAAISDYLENIMIVFLKVVFPLSVPAYIYVLNFFIIGKFICISISTLLIFAGLLSQIKGGDSGLIFGNKFRGSNKKE